LDKYYIEVKRVKIYLPYLLMDSKEGMEREPETFDIG